MINNKVSIVVPFYNSKKWLRHCITCLIKQTYNNIEILLIDDGSTDEGKREILDLIDNTHVFFYEITHRGVSAARNYGIEKATGQYIVFIDVDDSPKPEYVETLLKDICLYNTDAVICNYYEFNDNSSHRIVHDLPWSNMIIDNSQINSVLIPNMIWSENKPIMGSAWRMICSTNTIKNENIKFTTGVVISEDLLFTIQLYRHCSKIYIENDALYGYRKSDVSSMNGYKPTAFSDNMNFQMHFKKMLISENMYDENKIAYERQYLSVYTKAISNAVRTTNIRDSYRKIKEIVPIYRSEKNRFNSIQNLSILIRLTLFLLEHDFVFLLILLYRAKEIMRMIRN